MEGCRSASQGLSLTLNAYCDGRLFAAALSTSVRTRFGGSILSRVQYGSSMKNLKLALLAIGAIALIVGGVMLFMTVSVDMKVVWEIATRYQGSGTKETLHDPRPKMLIISAIALGGGFLIGLGLGLPLHRALSQKKIDAMVEQRVQQRLAGTPETPEQPAN